LRTKATVLAAVIGMLLAALPVAAHHSFAAEFDDHQPVKLTGTVTKLEWMNPHARFYVDIKDDKGVVSNWEFELAALNALIRAGWTRNSLKPGDVITVEGFRAKDGSKLANATAVTLANGKRVFAASSHGDTGSGTHY
jgi:cytochrome bd-type quinol oxidase subunit 1